MGIIKLSYKEIKWLRSKYNNGEVLHLNKASIIKKCKFCGKYYTPHHHKQVYCCKDCSKKAHQDQKNEWKRTKWVRPKSIGTGYIDKTRNKDFNEEKRIIKKELKRLGLE